MAGGVSAQEADIYAELRREGRYHRDINARTDEKIISGLVWTTRPGGAIPVWLSTENQFNFKSAYDLAVQKVLPVTFKMGERDPSITPLRRWKDADFYLAAAHINTSLRRLAGRRTRLDTLRRLLQDRSIMAYTSGMLKHRVQVAKRATDERDLRQVRTAKYEILGTFWMGETFNKGVKAMREGA